MGREATAFQRVLRAATEVAIDRDVDEVNVRIPRSMRDVVHVTMYLHEHAVSGGTRSMNYVLSRTMVDAVMDDRVLVEMLRLRFAALT